MMRFDVYDVDLGKQLGSFKSEEEALARVCLLLEDFGPDYVNDLELGYGDGRPNLTGEALRCRVEQVMRQAPSDHRGSPVPVAVKR